jgi:hypothetical protein
LAEALAPKKIIEELQDFENQSDRKVFVLAELILTVAVQATESWLKGELRCIDGESLFRKKYRGFDPNPGDGGCQIRGLLHLPSF